MHATLDAAGTRIDYRINDQTPAGTARPVDVHATPEELARFEADGYLVRERLFQGDALEHLRRCIDEIVDEESRREGFRIGTGRGFGGVFIRRLLDRHEGLHVFLACDALTSVARAMLGPQVWMRDMVARVSYPGQPNQETEWHWHQRVVPQPVPPWFSFPHIVDALVYLDDLTDATGPICVVPGSHKRIHEGLPSHDFADKAGQATLRLPAGSAVLIHGNLWHRAMPTLPHGTRRRLIIAGFAPTWIKAPPFDKLPNPDGLMARRCKDGSAEDRELLGLTGFY
ncbi:MAG: phytanoyl-CoA dioxygenase family protein [Planctomycetota bacterium]|nr:phytanoyl-CoA dioxygenase family protein [Planctomycetota bacterium]